MPDIKRTMPESAMPGPEAQMAQPAQKKGGWGTKILVIIIIIVVILVGLYLVSKYTSWNILNVDKEAVSSVETKGWNAVFLSNGQVYFGRIAKQTERTLVLEEIYYLQVTQQIQPAEGEPEPQQNLSLVKLGNELHGPQDAMNINMDHVLFTEELKPDSRVVDAVKRYLETGE